VRGQVSVTRLAQTRGTFLSAAWHRGRLITLAYEDERLLREDGQVVLEGPLNPRLRLALWGDETLLATRGRLLRLSPASPPRALAVDEGWNGPAFACGESGLAWAEGGRLSALSAPTGRGLRGALAGACLGQVPMELGEILPVEGRFWLGPGFGLGFYRAGALGVYYVFHPGRGTFQDAVALPPLVGALVGAEAVLSERLGWLVTATEAQGRRTLRAAAVTPQGRVAGLVQVDPGSDEEEARWLLSVGGACAVGEALFVPTDEGVVRVEVDQGAIRRARTFVDTEPFVDRACTLRPVPGGLIVISGQEIRRLILA
jgi:hypothetical protein